MAFTLRLRGEAGIDISSSIFLWTYRPKLSTHCLCVRGVYHQERTGHFSIKIKMLFSGDCPPPFPEKKKTLVLNQGSRCLYVFIYLDIYSVFCQAVCLPGCIPEILKTYMAKPQRSKTSVLWTLHSTLGQSLEWFVLEELSQSCYQPHHVLRNVSDGDRRTWWRARPNWGSSSPLCWVWGICGSPSGPDFSQLAGAALGSCISTPYCWCFCYSFKTWE